MDRRAKVYRLVEGACFDVQHRGMAAALMPEARAAIRTKRAVQRMPRRGDAGPERRLAFAHFEGGSFHCVGNAKSGRGLLLAFGAVAHIQRFGRRGRAVTDTPALATAEA